MSDTLVTMDDGSQTLVHYGVKGMKWHKHIMAGKTDAENEKLASDASEIEAETSGSSDPMDRLQNKLASKIRDNSEIVRERKVSKSYIKDAGFKKYMSVSIKSHVAAARAHKANKVLNAMLRGTIKKQKQRNVRNQIRSRGIGEVAVSNRRAKARNLYAFRND